MKKRKQKHTTETWIWRGRKDTDGRGRVTSPDDRRLVRDKVKISKTELRAACIRRGTTLHVLLLQLFGPKDRARIQQSITRGWMRLGEAAMVANKLDVSVDLFRRRGAA